MVQAHLEAHRAEVLSKGFPLFFVRFFPYEETHKIDRYNRRDLALDCFKLSFCLMGINTADLYNTTDFDGKVIVYYRTKTKDRRNDNAEIQIDVPSCIMPIVENIGELDVCLSSIRNIMT